MDNTLNHGHNHNRLLLPEWMQSSPDPNGSLSAGSSRARFLRRSLLEIRRAAAELWLAEKYAGSNGWLQKIDPRHKLIGTFILLLTIGLTRSWYLLAGIWLLTIALMWGSRLPLAGMQIRIWGSIPLITLLISAPAMLNIFVDGTPVVLFYHHPGPITWAGITVPDTIFISRQGLAAGLYLFTRVGLSLSVGFLLTLTTPAASLFKSLQELRVPVMLITVAEMSYRYLGLLLNLSLEMFEARKLRTVGELSPDFRRAQVGSSIAALFSRSMALADELYLAMAARGYTGNPVSFKD